MHIIRIGKIDTESSELVEIIPKRERLLDITVKLKIEDAATTTRGEGDNQS